MARSSKQLDGLAERYIKEINAWLKINNPGVQVQKWQVGAVPYTYRLMPINPFTGLQMGTALTDALKMGAFVDALAAVASCLWLFDQSSYPLPGAPSDTPAFIKWMNQRLDAGQSGYTSIHHDTGRLSGSLWLAIWRKTNYKWRQAGHNPNACTFTLKYRIATTANGEREPRAVLRIETSDLDALPTHDLKELGIVADADGVKFGGASFDWDDMGNGEKAVALPLLGGLYWFRTRQEIELYLDGRL